jgi:hypothetical protein
MLVSIASGIRSSREKQIITPTSMEIITFGDMEIAGYLFPSNDLHNIDRTNIIWASPLFSTIFQDFDKRFPNVKQLISTEVEALFKDIGDPLENYLAEKSSYSLLSSIVFKPTLAREKVWVSPVKKGEALARAVATTIWLRYCVRRLELTGSFAHSIHPPQIDLLTLIGGLPQELAHGKL